MNRLQGQNKKFIIFPIVILGHVFFQVSREFFFKTRHVCIVGQFQISIQPIPSPHIHPVRLDNGIKGKKRIELDLRILRDVFQNPRYNETRSVTTVMRNGFAYRIFFVKQFPGG